MTTPADVERVKVRVMLSVVLLTMADQAEIMDYSDTVEVSRALRAASRCLDMGRDCAIGPNCPARVRLMLTHINTYLNTEPGA